MVPVITEIDLKFTKISLRLVNDQKKVFAIFLKSEQPIAVHSKH